MNRRMGHKSQKKSLITENTDLLGNVRAKPQQKSRTKTENAEPSFDDQRKIRG